MLDFSLLEGDDLQPAARELEQLVAAQEKIGIRGPAELLVAHHEGVVEEHAAVDESGEQQRKQRSVQIVHDDNPREASFGIGPGISLDVGTSNGHVGNAPQLRQRFLVSIHGLHGMSERGEQARMPSATARDVEHAPLGRNQPCEPSDPRGGFSGVDHARSPEFPTWADVGHVLPHAVVGRRIHERSLRPEEARGPE